MKRMLPYMKLLSHKNLGRILEFGLVGLMVLAAALMVTLPWTITDVTMHVPGESGHLYEKYFAVLLVSGLIAELILWQSLQVMHNINRGNAFSDNTVRRLRIIGWECLAIALFYFVMVFFVHKFFMVVVFVAFAILGMVLFVMAQLFYDACSYKKENEMTI